MSREGGVQLANGKMRQSKVTLLLGGSTWTQTKNTLNILKQFNVIVTLRSCKFRVFCMYG